jgi:hypothetical protein
MWTVLRFKRSKIGVLIMNKTSAEYMQEHYERGLNFGAANELQSLFIEVMESENFDKGIVLQMIIDRQARLREEFKVMVGLGKEIKGE